MDNPEKNVEIAFTPIDSGGDLEVNFRDIRQGHDGEPLSTSDYNGPGPDVANIARKAAYKCRFLGLRVASGVEYEEAGIRVFFYGSRFIDARRDKLGNKIIAALAKNDYNPTIAETTQSDQTA